MSLLPVRGTRPPNHSIQILTYFQSPAARLGQKPMRQYRNAISSMQGMLDILTGLRKIREHIPVREAVTGVVNERREFVRGCPSLGPTSVCLMHESTYCHRYLVYVSRCTRVNMHSGRASRCRNSSLLPGTRVPRSSRASNSPCTFHSVSLGCRTCMWLRRAKYNHTSSMRLKICSVSADHCSVPPRG